MDFADHRADPAAWARALGISLEAVQVYLAAEVIDLHVDTFIWTRIFGYDPRKRHGRGPTGARFFSQVDLPRLREAGVGGAIWSITTNPFRTAAGRARAFQRNAARLRALLESVPEHVALVRDSAEYRAARAAGKHAVFLGIQGGNALDRDPAALDLLPDRLVIKVTLVHLTRSRLGHTSAPGGGDGGLTAAGRAYVERLNHERVFVDLAHINRRGFFDALEVHDRSLPALVSHTGVTGVRPHWRNIDDEQIKALADTGGTIGIIYESSFLGPSKLNGRASWIVDHLDHIVRVAGEDFASLGSDWDGLIVPPRDMPTCLELPRLVQLMLDRGWSAERIHKILGGNFLRALSLLRGERRERKEGREDASPS